MHCQIRCTLYKLGIHMYCALGEMDDIELVNIESQRVIHFEMMMDQHYRLVLVIV